MANNKYVMLILLLLLIPVIMYNVNHFSKKSGSSEIVKFPSNPINNQPQPVGNINQPQPVGNINQPQPVGNINQPQPVGNINQPQPVGNINQPNVYNYNMGNQGINTNVKVTDLSKYAVEAQGHIYSLKNIRYNPFKAPKKTITLKKVEKQAKSKFKLNAIWYSKSKPIAIIEGNIVNKGDILSDGISVVEDISKYQVIINQSGRKIVLRMGE